MAIPLQCFMVTNLSNGDSAASIAHWLTLHNCALNCTTLTCWAESESDSDLLYDWRFTASQFVLETGPLKLTTSKYIFQLSTCGYSPSVTSSLITGWVCHLQLLLVLASAVILRSESRGTHDHILCLRLETPQPGGPGPIFISPVNRVARLYPQALDSLFVASYD
jgi:hypothetical protein